MARLDVETGPHSPEDVSRPAIAYTNAGRLRNGLAVLPQVRLDYFIAMSQRTSPCGSWTLFADERRFLRAVPSNITPSSRLINRK
jgi:hypothetical protein